MSSIITQFSPSDGTDPAVIEQCVILTVDTATKTCEVSAMVSQRSIPRRVPYATPMLHGAFGSGAEFAPEPDTICYVCTPADGTGSFIFAYLLGPTGVNDDIPINPDTDLSYAGSRAKQQPGDISFTTRDNNFIHLRRGGLLSIGASPRAQTVYLPIENLIRCFYDRLQHMTPLGELLWDRVEFTSEESTDETSDIPTLLKFGVREKINQQLLTLEVRLGQLSADVLDTAVDSNLLREGKTTSVSVVGEDYEQEVVETGTGAGDSEHLFGAQMREQASGLGAGRYNAEDDATPLGITSFVLRDADNNTVTSSLQCAKDGTIFLRTVNHLHVESRTSYIFADDRIKLHSRKIADDETETNSFIDIASIADYIKIKAGEALLELLTSGEVVLEGADVTLKASGQFKIECDGDVEIKGRKVVFDTDHVEIGKGAKGTLLAGAGSDFDPDTSTPAQPGWLETLAAHTHSVPNGPPDVSPAISGKRTDKTATTLKIKL